MGERQKLKAKKLLPFDHKGILAQEAQVYKDFTHILGSDRLVKVGPSALS